MPDDSADASTPPVSPANTSPQHPVRQVTDAELEGLLGTPPAVVSCFLNLFFAIRNI